MPLPLKESILTGELSRVDVIGSEQSFLMSMMIAARRAGTERNVAWRDDASCSCVNTGRRLCGFTLA